MACEPLSPSFPSTCLVNPDSGTSANFFALKDKHILSDIVPDSHPIAVALPDGTVKWSTHTALLNIPCLPIAARNVRIIDGFVGSLLSIATLCDNGLSVVYNSESVRVCDGGATLFSGARDLATGLWCIDLTTAAALPPHVSLSASVLSTVKVDTGSNTACATLPVSISTTASVVSFYHACMGSPTIPTLLHAVSNGWVKLPGLTAAMLRRHPPDSIATAKGHLNQHRAGVNSTAVREIYDESTGEWYPTSQRHSYGKADIMVRVQQATRVGQHHMDLTGQFPITSKAGHRYMMVMFCEDTNYIHVEPLRSRSGSDITDAYRCGNAFWRRHNVVPQFLRLDNETSGTLRAYCASEHISMEYVPPHSHRANRAERAIGTWKNHFISCMATAHPAFPAAAWDKLLPHAEMTLNLMRGSGVSPHISAWHQVRGAYDFNRTPIAPPGIRIVCHEKPNQRGTWAAHGKDGYYVGPSLLHYRCYQVWINETESVRDTDSISWHPVPPHTLPGASPYDDMLAGILSLTTALVSFSKSDSVAAHQRQPLAQSVPPLIEALLSLRNIFSPAPDSAPSADIYSTAPPGLPHIDDTAANIGHPINELYPVTVISDNTYVSSNPIAATKSNAPVESLPTNVPPASSEGADHPWSYAHPGSKGKRYIARRRHVKPATISASVPITSTARTGSRQTRLPSRYRSSPLITATSAATHSASAVQMSDVFALDDNGKPLTWLATRRGIDRDLWIKADDEAKPKQWFSSMQSLSHRIVSLHTIIHKLK
jgi:hypothetical protein